MTVALNRILIVEDEFIVREHLKAIMVDLGAKDVLLASRGSEAVAKAQGQNLDLVIMDIVLPGDMDGIEAAGIIQDFAEVPVIFLTAFQNSQRIFRAAQRHLRAFMNKPISDSQLKSTVLFTLTAAQKRQKSKLSLPSLSSQVTSGIKRLGTEGDGSLFQLFFEKLPTAAAIISRDGRIKRVNPRLALMYGLNTVNIVGQNVGTFMGQPVDPAHENFEEWLKSLGEETSIQKDLLAMHSNGEMFPVRLTMESGIVRGEALWFCTLLALERMSTQEISDQDWTQILNASNENLQRGEALAKNSLVSFAHEIRNPLTVAMGFSHKIKEQADGDILLSAEMVTLALARISDFLKRMTQQSGHGDTLDAQLMNLANDKAE